MSQQYYFYRHRLQECMNIPLFISMMIYYGFMGVKIGKIDVIGIILASGLSSICVGFLIDLFCPREFRGHVSFLVVALLGVSFFVNK